MPNPLLEAALSYARKGWRVFPLQDAGTPTAKEPRRGSKGFYDGTIDEVQINKWWEKWPNANIGIATGEMSGIFVFDLDVSGEAGELVLVDFYKDREKFPQTYEVKTSKGKQLYFIQPMGSLLKNTAGELGEHIDIRADKGYVVAPPSVHPSGVTYTLVRDQLPAVAPKWLLELSLYDKPSGSTHKKKDRTIPDKVKKGGRDAFIQKWAGMQRAHGLGFQEINGVLQQINIIRCEPPLSETDVTAKAQKICEKEPGRFNPFTGEETGAEMKGLTLVDYANLPVIWRWPGKLPENMLSLWSGDPGLGKSTIAYDIAARVTRGKPMPGDDTPIDYEPGMVLVLSAEDDMQRTIRPRMELAGADLSMVKVIPQILTNGKTIAFPEHVDQLRNLILESEAKLVIIDPLDSFLGSGIDSHNNASVRSVLAPLSKLANETDIVLLIISHLNKSSNSAGIYRIGGSIGFAGAARVIAVFGKSQMEEGINLFGILKNNLALQGKPLKYRIQAEHIEGIGQISKIVWMGESETETVNSILAAPLIEAGEGKAVAEAKAFLLQELIDGPKPTKHVQRSAASGGISQATLRRAMDEVGSKKNVEGQFMWALKTHKWQEELFDNKKGEL
jgi:hypothetical protein